MSTENCTICVLPYTGSRRTKVTCSACQNIYCLECFKHYLCQIQDPACMYCKVQLSVGFLHTYLSAHWMKTIYNQHRQDLILGIEKSRMGEIQEVVEQIVECQSKRKIQDEELLKINQQIQLLEQVRKDILVEEGRLQSQITNLYTGRVKPKPSDKKSFVKRCVANNCDGYLSSQWKCSKCECWVCRECHEPKQTREDQHHICNPDQMKSVDALKKLTKPCPNCQAPIQKSEGCYQMWCTNCQTAFDWTRGTIINSPSRNFHNPHYNDWINRNPIEGAGCQRNDGECGPRQILQHQASDNELIPYIKYYSRYRNRYNEIRDIINRKTRVPDDAAERRWMRICLFRGSISEHKFKTGIMALDKKINKVVEYQQIYDTFLRVFQDILLPFEQAILEVLRVPQIDKHQLKSLEQSADNVDEKIFNLRIYINDCIRKIIPYVGKMESCFIGSDIRLHTYMTEEDLDQFVFYS